MEKKLPPEAGDDKAELTLLEGGPRLTLEGVLAFGRQFPRWKRFAALLVMCAAAVFASAAFAETKTVTLSISGMT